MFVQDKLLDTKTVNFDKELFDGQTGYIALIIVAIKSKSNKFLKHS